jgi:uncharacterized lipoprotein YmbA
MRSSRAARARIENVHAMTTPNTPRPRMLIPCAVVGLLGLLAACNVVPPPSDDPTRYFILSDPAAAAVQAPPAGAARIGLREISLESYLRKREIVVRTGDNEIQFRDFRRWAEPLESAIVRIVRLRLLEAPEVAQVYTEPFPLDQAPDFEVKIDVRRCEGAATPSGKYVASFAASLEISTTGATPHVVTRKLFTAPDAAWDGRDFDRLASLLSADVAALGQEVAADIPARN